MKELGLGGYLGINEFVAAKLQKLNEMPAGFGSLFELMFSEKENLLYEKSEGYRIRQTTYGEAYEETLRLAAALKTMLDLPHGAAVGLSMENSLRWIELFWAILLCGWNPLLLNLRLSDALLEQALRSCGARAVISDGRQYAVRTLAANEIVPAGAPFAPCRFGEELLVMSSGTSDHVKICAYSAEELRCQIRDSYEIIRICAPAKEHYDGYIKQLCFLPFYHVFGLIAVYIWFAFFSRAFVQLNDMQPQTILNTIKRHKVTHIFAVPLFWETVYEQAIKTIKSRGEKTYRKFLKGMRIARRFGSVPALARAFGKTAFKEVRENLFGESVRFMITGGGAIREEVMTFFNAIGYHLADGYGMTEIGITSVELSDRPSVLNVCSVGMPLSGTEYQINESGELLVRGGVLTKYIIEDGKKTVSDKQAWFNTHDLAAFSGGGYRILGRTDDLIVTANGENLNPNLTEPLLRTGGTDGVCLIDGGNTAVLLVSVNRCITQDRLETLGKQLKEAIAAADLTGQIGKIVYITEPLMKDGEFKLNRRRLAADYRDGRLAVANPRVQTDSSEQDALLLALRQMIAAGLDKPLDEVAPQADFFTDLGGTSLDYFALLAKLQEDYGIPFPQGDGSPRTAQALHDFITETNGKDSLC